MDERCDHCKEEMGDVRLTGGKVLCATCFKRVSQKSHNTQDLNTLRSKE